MAVAAELADVHGRVQAVIVDLKEENEKKQVHI